MNRGGSDREGDTESETGFRLWAVSTEPDAGLELTDRKIMTWAEVGRLTHWATQAPQDLILKQDMGLGEQRGQVMGPFRKIGNGVKPQGRVPLEEKTNYTVTCWSWGDSMAPTDN